MGFFGQKVGILFFQNVLENSIFFVWCSYTTQTIRFELLFKVLKKKCEKNQKQKSKEFFEKILAIENSNSEIRLQVEKKIGKAGIKVEPKVFRDACREFALKQVDKQKIDFERLGVLGDWEHPYLTMNYATEANIIRSLGKIITAGHLHKGVKPVHWCIDCCSALAEAEVEYFDKKSPSIDVRFHVIEYPQLLNQFNINKNIDSFSVVIWTTTPWTLPANQAVALHPDNEYVIVQVKNEALIISSDLHEVVLARYGYKDYEILSKFSRRNSVE